MKSNMMSQKNTDFGAKGESGERSPKGATASDTKGERRNSVPRADSERGSPGQSGESYPKGVAASDKTGEKRERMAGGVGMGMADGIGERDASHMGKHDGRLGEMKGGSSEKVCYEHNRSEYK